MQTTPVRWTTADLELFAGDSRSETLLFERLRQRERKNRYEIIDGELFVTKSHHLVGIINQVVAILLQFLTIG
jgi:hypothetical protein